MSEIGNCVEPIPHLIPVEWGQVHIDDSPEFKSRESTFTFSRFPI